MDLIVFFIPTICVLMICRGKGDYFRLGHGTDAHVRKPQLVEGLKGKKIIHVAVGALHCLAVTDTGQVLHPCGDFQPSRNNPFLSATGDVQSGIA